MLHASVVDYVIQVQVLLKGMTGATMYLQLLPNASLGANSVDPDQTAPTGAVWCGSTLFDREIFIKCFSRLHKQMTSVVITGLHSAFGNVSGNRCESDCRSRGRAFDPSPVPYFRGD